MSDHAVNSPFVLSLLLSGDGAAKATKTMGLIDLPCSSSIDRTAHPALQCDISIHIIEHMKTLSEEALLDEVREWAKQEGNSSFNFAEWEGAWKNDKPFPFNKMPQLMVSHDVGWQKRSSGRRCDSHSGHAAAAGA